MSKRSAASDFLAGGGECGAMIRAKDWSQTPLGPVEQWPQSLKTAVRIILTSRQPMFVWWGKQLINLYNDPYRDIVGGKHPVAMGQPASEVWSEIWDQVGPRAKKAISNNVGTYDEALLLIMERHGYPEETYYTFSYSPIPGESGRAEGIICANSDDTNGILGERQLTTLRDLAAQTGNARSATEVCRLAAKALKANPRDVPFALLYLENQAQARFELQATVGFTHRHKAAPKVEPMINGSAVWPLKQALETSRPVLIEVADTKLARLPKGAWSQQSSKVAVLPFSRSKHAGPRGVLVLGLNPFRLYEGGYEEFIKLMAGEISASMANAEAYAYERKRAEELAELDRAKTNFFSNVSHEFRTPLTLILGPLEEVVQRPQLPAPSTKTAVQLEVAYRNALRLQKLVNNLLDFSRIEAGRVQALYVPTDLTALTADLASNFRSAIERAGMKLKFRSKPLRDPAYVDREMWEKIVLNLLSNAFKYTLKGTINVELHQVGQHVVLKVSDTGIGIKPEEMPRLFERFHRVKGAQGRTHEGTGIGLSLVQELVRLHGGAIEASSTYGKGTIFTVTIPTGSAHLPTGHVSEETMPLTTLLDEQYVQEALRWLQIGADNDSAPQANVSGLVKPHILLADDNTDMRQYVARLLEPFYRVTAVADGRAALQAVREGVPDMVISDIMMPEVDGFGLLQALRQDAATNAVPVILLSARAGEEARIEGLDAGADDYLAKPFSARELLARVHAHLEIAHTRKQAAQETLEERERLRNLLLHAPASVAILSGPDLRFELANANYHRLVGVNRNIDGKKLTDALPELEPEILAIIQRVAFKGERFVANEYPVVLDWDGNGVPTTKYLNFIYEPLFDENHKPNGLTVFAYEVTEQVVSRQRVQENGDQLKLIADAIPAFVSYVSVDGRYQFANKAYDEWFGVTTTVDGGIHARDVLGLKNYKAAKPFMTRVLAGERVSYEPELHREDGQVKYIHAEYIPDKAADGTVRGFVVVGNDITERKQAEMQLRASEERFRALIEQSADAIQLVDIEGSLLYSSDSVEHVLGYTSAELQNTKVGSYIHPKDYAAYLEVWNKVLRKAGNQVTHQYRVKHKQGMWVWLETTLTNRLDTPNINAVVGNFRNITARKQVEMQLRASEERFRFMAEALPQKIFTTTPDGELDYFNPQWESYSGASAVQIRLGGTDQFIHPDDVAANTKRWRRSMKTGEPYEIEQRLRRYDGTYRLHITRALAMRDDIGSIVMWIGSNTDIDDMRRAAERRHELELKTTTLTEQRAQLMALNQAKDEFISLASHQLRTPATGVKQYLAMLLQGYAGEVTDDQKAFLETAYESNERQITIVNDLLRVARIDAGKVSLELETTDLVRLVKNVVNEHASKFAERNQKVILLGDYASLLAQVDADRIRMVFDNIIDNAIKYTEPGKKITITVGKTQTMATVSVTDQGVGMAKQDINRIFQKFSRLEDPMAKGVEGSGLGLYWAQKIIDLHHGMINVTSNVGKGTTFTVNIPL